MIYGKFVYEGSKIWNAVKNGPLIPTSIVDGVSSPKPKTSWEEDYHKKVIYDEKAINIYAFSLGMDKFFRVSNCKSAKEIWDTSEVTREGTEYEMFRMLTRERYNKNGSYKFSWVLIINKLLKNNWIANICSSVQNSYHEEGRNEEHQKEIEKHKNLWMKI